MEEYFSIRAADVRLDRWSENLLYRMKDRVTNGWLKLLKTGTVDPETHAICVTGGPDIGLCACVQSVPELIEFAKELGQDVAVLETWLREPLGSGPTYRILLWVHDGDCTTRFASHRIVYKAVSRGELN